MSISEIPRYPAGQYDDVQAPELEPERVSFGGAQTLEAETGRAVIALWLERARANVGTALTDPEVGARVVELLTPDVMTLILTAWRNRNAALFGAYLAEALTGTRPSASRNRGPR